MSKEFGFFGKDKVSASKTLDIIAIFEVSGLGLLSQLCIHGLSPTDLVDLYRVVAYVLDDVEWVGC